MSKNMEIAAWISAVLAVLLVAGITWRATQPAYDHTQDVLRQAKPTQQEIEQKDIDFFSQQSNLVYTDFNDGRYTVVKVVMDDNIGLDRVVIKRQDDGMVFSVPVKPGLKMTIGEQVCIASFVYYFNADGYREEIKFAVPAAGATPRVGR